MKGRKIVVWAALPLFLLISWAVLCRSHYTIERNCIDSTVYFPQIQTRSFDPSRVNEAIRSNLYGPYPFLADREISVDMDFEVAYSDRNLISICYKGVYAADRGTYTGSFCFGVTVDLEQGSLLDLKKLYTEEELSNIRQMISDEEYEVIYGALGNGPGLLTVEEFLEARQDFWSEGNVFGFFIEADGVNFIIEGLPGYMGDYGVIKVTL